MATIAPPNSFLVPQQAVQSGLSAYRPSQFGVMQPYVSDLLTAQPGANKYMGATYVGDPTKIQERLNQYSNISGRDLEGLRDYFSPLALQSSKFTDKLLFKKSDLEQAQSQLGALNADQLSALQQDLASYTPVGTAKGSTYYKRPELEQALSNYAVVPEDKWTNYNKYAQDLGVSPVTMFGNTPLLKKDQAEKFMQTVNLGEWLNKINPMRTREEIYQAPAPDLNQGWAAAFNRNNNVDPSSLSYQARQVYDGEGGYTTEWYKTVPETPMTIEDFWATYGATPAGGWSDENTKYAGGRGILGLLGRGSSSNPLQRWMSDASYLPNFSLYGSGSPEDIQRGFNVLQRMSPQNIGEFWSLGKDVQKGMLENPAAALQFMRATANPANHDWLSVGAEGGFSGFDAYKWDPTTGLTVDPSRYMQIDDSNNGLLGSLNQALGKIDPIGHVIEGGVAGVLGFNSGLDMVRTLGEPVGNAVGYIFAGGLPLGSMVMAADNLSTGNDKALMGNVISGLTSYAGANMPTSSVAGTGYSLGSSAANAAANQALISSMATAARGGNMKDVLTSAALSGLGGYSGSLLGGYTQGMSPLAKMATQTAYGAGMGGLSSALRGRDIGYGATQGALSGLTNSTMRALLANQLYKGLV